MRKSKPPLDSTFLDGDNASYDEIAKRFLAHKSLLAQILKELVEEFKDCSLHDIAKKYIEGEPAVNIREIPIDPDLTNTVKRASEEPPEKIQGLRNEDSSPTEGTIVFDILFHATLPTTNEPITLINQHRATAHPLHRLPTHPTRHLLRLSPDFLAKGTRISRGRLWRDSEGLHDLACHAHAKKCSQFHPALSDHRETFIWEEK